MRFGIVGKPSHNLGQFARCGMQVRLKPGIIPTSAELITQIPEESRGKPEQIRATKSVIQRYDLMDMTIYRLKKLRPFNLRPACSVKRCLE